MADITKEGGSIKVKENGNANYYPIDDIRVKTRGTILFLLNQNREVERFEFVDINLPTGADIEEKADKISGLLNTSRDALLELSLRNIKGYESVIIEASSMDIDQAVEDIWGAGDFLVYLDAAEKMNIASTLASDAIAGTGVRTVEIVGIDDNHIVISETVDTDGTNNVLTTKSYLRVRSLEVKTRGTSDANEGNITATAETAATVQCFMVATVGISKNSQYTVPAGKLYLPLGAELNATKLTGGTSPNIEFNILIRKLGESVDAPWLKVVERKMDTSVLDQLFINEIVGDAIPEKTDVRFTAVSDVNNAEVRVRFYGVLIDK